MIKIIMSIYVITGMVIDICERMECKREFIIPTDPLRGERGANMDERKSKVNCWEFKKCGRQPQGKNVAELGLCPAAVEDRLDGEHDGVNGGRACWVVAGTLCKGEVQGTFAEKFKSCEQCAFYLKVKKEEWPSFKLSVTLRAKIRDKKELPAEAVS